MQASIALRSAPAVKIRLLIVTLSALLGGFFVPAVANAAIVTAATGGTAISADTTSALGGTNTSTTLGPITIVESALDDFQFTAGTAVTLILNAPTGFEFDITSSPDVAFLTNGDINTATTTSFTSSTLTITVTPDVANVTNSVDNIAIGSVTPLKVRPTTGVAGTSGNITHSGTISIIGVTTGSANFGTLTVVAGAPDADNSTFSCDPSVQVSGGIFTCNIVVEDQFGNPVQNAQVNLSASGTGNIYGNNNAFTNAAGAVTITLASTVAEAKTVTATVNGTVVLSTIEEVAFSAGPPTQTTIVATPNPQEASLGGSDVTLDITITDQHGNLVNDGVAVTVSGVATTSGTVTVTGSGSTVDGQVTRTLNFTNKGSVTLTVNVSSGNLSLTGDSVVYFIDTTVPVITLNGSNPDTVEYRGVYTDAGATAEDNIDGNITGSIITVNPVDPNVSNVTPDTVTKIVGVYTVTYNVSDSSGNAADQQTRTVNVVDTTVPEILSITSDATLSGALKIGDTITFTLTPSVAEPVATVDGSYNGQPLVWSSSNGGNTYTATYAVEEFDTDQPSPLQISGVIMTDEAGNTSDPASGGDIAKTIDANLPTVSTVNSDGVTYNIASPSSATIQVMFNEDLSVEPTIDVSSDAQTVTDCGDADAMTFCFEYVIPAATDSIVKTINISLGTDLAGNVMLVDSSHTFIVDTLAPAAPTTPDLDAASDLGDSPTDDLTRDATPTFNGTAEANSTVTLYEDATVLGSALADGSGNWTVTASELSDGVHTITALATDAAGNNSPVSDGLTVTIETVSPDVSITSPTADPTNVSPIPVMVTFTEDTTTFAEEDLTVGNGVVSDFSAVSGTIYTFNVTPSGQVTVTVDVAAGVATDEAGNGNTVAAQLSRTFDSVEPTVTEISLSDSDGWVKQGDSLTITATFSEDMAASPDVMIELTGTNAVGPVAMTRDDATHYSYVHSVGAGDGTVDVSITGGTDLATNTLTPLASSSVFTVDNTKPVIEPHEPVNEIADATGGATVTYTNPVATDLNPAEPVVTCELVSGEFFPLGDTTVLCDATDAVGNAADQTSFTVTVDPDVIARVTVSADPTTLTTDEASDLTINGRDQYNNITTNQSGTVVVVAADNGGALSDTIVTLADGQASAELTKESEGAVHVTVSSGILLPGNTTVTFTPADDEGPSITSFSPAEDTTDVSVTAPLFFITDEALDLSSVHSGNIQLWKAAVIIADDPDTVEVDESLASTPAEQVDAVVSLVEGGMRVNITPDSALEYDTSYYFVFTDDVADEAGNELQNPKDEGTTGFTTEANVADVTAPVILAFSPADGATNVANGTVPSITWSEALDPTTVTNDNIKLWKYGSTGNPADDEEISVIVSLGAGGTEVFLTPTAPLEYSTHYYYTVAGAVADLAGNTFGAPLDASTRDAREFTVQSDPNTAVVLAVTGIDTLQSFATADNTFENGWSWSFHVTVPSDETEFAMKFSDFTSGANTIAAADNIRYYTAQSTEADTAAEAVTIAGANAYPASITLDGDANTNAAGRQITVTVEMKVPVGSAGGSYSASYGVQSI